MLAPGARGRRSHTAKAVVNADRGYASPHEMTTAKSAQPAQILLGSRFLEGCRETAERAVAANLAMRTAKFQHQRFSGQDGKPTKQQPDPLPLKVFPGCGYDTSGLDG
jgi:hypothetical protein